MIHKIIIGVILLFIVLGPGALSSVSAIQTSTNIDRLNEASRSRGMAASRQDPLLFIDNRGQVDSEVGYYVKTPGQTLYLTGSGMIFDLIRHEQAKSVDLADGEAERLVFSLDFVGASTSSVIQGRGRDKAVVNYLIGNDPEKWHTDIPTYREVAYNDIYPGIDLRICGKGGWLEYEFVVQPGANAADIALAYGGVDRVAIDSDELVISTAFGEFKQSQPYIYQRISGNIVKIDGGFKLFEANTYGFEVAAYDRGYPLIIDPTLEYSICLGGTGEDVGMGIAVEGQHAYVTGYTWSTDFPTESCYTVSNQGERDAFVAKVNTSGSGTASLIYSTYLGGSDEDEGWSIAVENGCAYVSGSTKSDNFPTTSSGYTTSRNGLTDAFVAKLDASGTNLIYSTYLGSGSTDEGYGIAVENACAYVTGFTDSTFTTTTDAFPTTAGAFQTLQPGGVDCFVAKIDTTRSGNDSLIYSTYLGGAEFDYGRGIAVENECAYVTGATSSDNFPTAGALTASLPGTVGAKAAFVTRIDTRQSGNDSLIYSTYLGAENDDLGFGIAVESKSAYVTGWTESDYFPTKNRYMGRNPLYQRDAFVTRIDTTQSDYDSLIYSTYLGARRIEEGYGIAVEGEQAYITGGTNSQDFPGRKGYQSWQGGKDAFVTIIDTTQSDDVSLIYSTFLGGNYDDCGYGIAVEGQRAYVTGVTSSGNFPVSTTLTSSQSPPNAFVTRFGCN